MEKLTTLQKRLAVLKYAVEKGEIHSVGVLDDFILDVSLNTVNVILAELTKAKFLMYRVDSCSGCRRLYSIHPDFLDTLKTMVACIEGNQKLGAVA